jgi:hypothetical protein
MNNTSDGKHEAHVQVLTAEIMPRQLVCCVHR